MRLIVFFLVAYLIASFSPAIQICKLVKKEDIRTLGSKNAGTTNAIRVLGPFWGICVFLLDVLKVLIAYFCIYIIAKIIGYTDISMIKSIFLIAVVIGHCYPIYYGFKGGKGVAVMLTAAFVLNYKIALVCVIVGILIIAITRMVSLGSICGIVLFDIMILIMMPQYIIAALISSILVIFKHRANIKRIINNEENKLF